MKKLLKESEIRKMMKFANIGALTDGFVEKLNEAGYYEEDVMTEEEEEDVEDVDPAALADEPVDEPAVDEPVDEPAVDEPGLEEPGDDLGAGVTAEQGLEGLSKFLEAVTDPEVGPELAGKVQVTLADEPEMGDPGLEEPALTGEPVDEPAMAGPGLDEPGLDEPGLEAAPEEEEDLGELEEAQIDLEEDDAFVNEVVRKVAKRLLRKR